MIELDREVAAKVMGWKVEEKSLAGRTPGAMYWCHHLVQWDRIPAFSASIFDAWIVVQKLMGVGFEFQINHGIVMKDHSKFGSFEHAPEAPEAICRAALAAVVSK